MFNHKTIVKKPWSSMRLDQSTPRPPHQNPRTQVILNQETFSVKHGAQTTDYKVYQDF